MAALVRVEGRALIAFAAMVLLAGGNPVGIALVVAELPPLWSASLRFLTAGALFTVAMVVARLPLPRGRALRGAVLYGVVNFFGGFFALLLGFQEAPPASGRCSWHSHRC